MIGRVSAMSPQVQFGLTWKADKNELAKVKQLVSENFGEDEAKQVRHSLTYIEDVSKNDMIHKIDSIYQSLKLSFKQGIVEIFTKTDSPIFMFSTFPSKERLDSYLANEIGAGSSHTVDEEKKITQVNIGEDKMYFVRISETEILTKA